MKFPITAVAALVAVATTAQPAAAEVVKSDPQGFVTRDEVTVSAGTMATWLALISPGKWWNSAHTWSGDAANMSVTPQAGGCFCERIPEIKDEDKVTLEGSVRHMTVVQSFPERVLRMRGGLGPLQGEPADGVLTITLKPVDGGTRILWEYVVGGYMRYEVPMISKAVDGVMSQQLAGLADHLGRLDEAPATEEAGEADAPEAAAADEPEGDAAPEEPSEFEKAMEDIGR